MSGFSSNPDFSEWLNVKLSLTIVVKKAFLRIYSYHSWNVIELSLLQKLVHRICQESILMFWFNSWSEEKSLFNLDVVSPQIKLKNKIIFSKILIFETCFFEKYLQYLHIDRIWCFIYCFCWQRCHIFKKFFRTRFIFFELWVNKFCQVMRHSR